VECRTGRELNLCVIQEFYAKVRNGEEQKEIDDAVNPVNLLKLFDIIPLLVSPEDFKHCEHPDYRQKEEYDG
jgi:hypothetical protein